MPKRKTKKRKTKKPRKRKLKKHWLTHRRIGDLVFLIISGLVSLGVMFLFDIHHSFYTWPFELKFIFTTTYPYIIFAIVGAVLGLALLKTLVFAIEEEERK